MLINVRTTPQQILLEFYIEIEGVALDALLQLIFVSQVTDFLIDFLKVAKRHGCKTIEELLKNVDILLIKFFEHQWQKNNVEEIDIGSFRKKRYDIAS